MPKKILLADDDPNILKLVKLRLEANGYEVVTASDGEECMAKVFSEKPQLILLDLMMPKVDGYAVLVGLKEMHGLQEEIPDIPVIVLTAMGDSRVKDLVQKEHIADYVLKPFNSQDLLAKVKKALGE